MKKRKWMIVFLFIFGISQLFAASCGDVNNDGIVDIVDALLIAQDYVYLNPVNYDESVADVDDDGIVDIVDALLVAQFYVNLIEALECAQSLTPDPEITPSTELEEYELQAEEAARDDAAVETEHSGYTGTGYVNTANSSGRWIEWSVKYRVCH